MKKSTLLYFAAAMIGFAGIASSALASDAVLNDYSWAVLKDNPKFYWNFNRIGR